MPTFQIGNTTVRKDPVAYIDGDGDLVIRASANLSGGAAIVVLTKPLNPARPGFLLDVWSPESASNKTLFYPGDSVTITF